MISKIISLYRLYGKVSYLIIGLIIIILVNTVIFPYYTKTNFDKVLEINNIPDLQFGFSKEYILTTFEFFGEKNRKAYQFFLMFLDSVYAMIYGITYSFLFFIILKKKNKIQSNKLLITTPLWIGVFDIFENIGFIFLLKTHPDYPNYLINFASVSNQLKWIFAVFALFSLFYILILSKK